MKINVNSKNIICIILIAILLVFMTNVYAANDSYKTTLSSNKTTVTKNETITITIGLKDISIESGEKGIGAYTGKIDFDSSVLEYVSSSGTDKWEAPLYQNKLIVGHTKDGKVVNTAQDIGTITFKVKDNAKLGETTIKLTNFSGSTAVTDVESMDSSIEITIVDQNGSSGSIDENGSGNNGSELSGGNGSANENGNGDVNGSADGSGNTQNGDKANEANGIKVSDTEKENLKNGKLPQTGYSNIAIYVLLSLSSAIALIFGIRIKLINKKINKK